MAEPISAPALPSTADATPYVPVSWMAVGAFTVAAVFVGVLLALGISAFLAKKPLIQDELLALPAIGVVLSFAARRVIRNSEGTRTGERLANNAWWICVVAGLGYAAYLAGIAYSIRRDARQELERWINFLQTDEDHVSYNAFLRTREPAQRAAVSASDTKQIESRFRDDLVAFKQTDLLRLLRRNKGEGVCRFTVGGVRDWSYRAGGIDCTYAAVMKCPEGSFPLVIGLRGSEVVSGMEGAGRQWGIIQPPNGFIVREQQSLTQYGWTIQALEESGAAFGSQFLMSLRAGPGIIPYLYQGLIKANSASAAREWQMILNTLPGRMAATGGLAVTHPYTADYLAYSFSESFFKGADGSNPSSEQRAQFKSIWDSAGLLPSGARIKTNSEKHPNLRITDTSVEVSVPCELPLPGGMGSAAARGRIIVVSTDPGIAAELKQLRSDANPDAGMSAPPEGLGGRGFNWRIARVESDFVRVEMQRAGEGPTPGLPGPPP